MNRLTVHVFCLTLLLALCSPLLAENSHFHVYPRSSRARGRLLGRAIRTEQYRLVEWATQDRTFIEHELYDLEADPDENINIAGRKANGALVKRLSEQLAVGWRGALPE